MKTIYDNREAILAEPISKKSFRNKGLRLRKKLNRQQKIFEDRLGSVILQFSSKMDIDLDLISEIAKVWI